MKYLALILRRLALLWVIAIALVVLLYVLTDPSGLLAEILFPIFSVLMMGWMAFFLYFFLLDPFVRKPLLGFVIKSYRFPATLGDSLRARHPHLSDADVAHVIEALRLWLAMKLFAPEGETLASPSRVVSDAWEAFAMDAAEYRLFAAWFIAFPYRKPEPFIADARLVNERLRRTWKLACKLEELDDLAPSELPELFAIDASLKIVAGARYCLDPDRPTFDALIAPPRVPRQPAQLIEAIRDCVARYQEQPECRAELDALAEEIRYAIGRCPHASDSGACAQEYLVRLFNAIERVPDLWQAVFGDFAVARDLRERLCASPPDSGCASSSCALASTAGGHP
jgi:hypothetical protein